MALHAQLQRAGGRAKAYTCWGTTNDHCSEKTLKERSPPDGLDSIIYRQKKGLQFERTSSPAKNSRPEQDTESFE